MTDSSVGSAPADDVSKGQDVTKETSTSSSTSSDATPMVTETEGSSSSSSSSPSDPEKKDDNPDKDTAEDDGRTAEEKEREAKELAEAEKKRIEELKKKYADWPLRGIKDPHDNDVMYGRGGGTNHHPGNKRYRKMVEDRKLEYVNSKRLDKPLVALEIIRLWRAQLPPGRFLKLDEKTGLWSDVGDKKAREKTSQALREKAPLIRKQQEEGDSDEEGDERMDDDEEEGKTTRFAEGTKGDGPSGKVKKSVLARDHSLGREYLASGEAVTLDGFSWQDPFKPGGSKARSPEVAIPQPPPPPPSHGGPAPFVPAGRNSSSGSLGMAPPFTHHSSVGGPPPPPPPPDFYGRMTSGDQRREFSNSSLGSWGAPYPYPPPPPPPGVHGMHQRSGSWTQPLHPPSPHHGSHHQRSESWGGGREHSLSWNPLIGASISRPADRESFENNSRGNSGYWGEPVSPRNQYGVLPPPPPPPPPGVYEGMPYMSGGSVGPMPPGHPPHGVYRNPSPPTSNTPSPPYDVDLNIARSWSGGGEVRGAWPGEYPPPLGGEMIPPQSYDGHPRPVAGADSSPPRGRPHHYGTNNSHIPRPIMVKRDTSNQNESYETKTSIKRAALNRDQSATSNRLKQEYMPNYYNRQFDTEREMQTLQETTEQIRLSPGPGLRVEQPKPRTLAQEGRVTTMDVITMELMAKPAPLLDEHRMTTIDALELDLDGSDSMLKTEDLYDDSYRISSSSLSSLPKPASLGLENRLTTQEFLEIVSSPIVSVDDRSGNDDDPLPLVQ